MYLSELKISWLYTIILTFSYLFCVVVRVETGKRQYTFVDIIVYIIDFRFSSIYFNSYKCIRIEPGRESAWLVGVFYTDVVQFTCLRERSLEVRHFWSKFQICHISTTVMHHLTTGLHCKKFVNEVILSCANITECNQS